ncbi:type VII secretion-associated serine protease mycosin [Actinophytocola sp.]|uniref:type VII secretion-associated serine protease mycosin n=1 Tax=Actinophytocola sp. TaxID=1872138 RepID=UPI0025C6EC7F|nr:type VII secretion-associated serine protease mycosin [Actinophytocola sp.]
MAVTRTRRVFSVLAATLVFATMPAVAAAQPASPSSPPAADEGFAKPPPLPADFPVPTDDGKPDKAYTQKTQCVASRGQTVELQHKPWGQDVLRFEELSRFATGRGQKVAVIDTGVSPHDYLAGRLQGGGDYVVEADNGLRDCDGHGTEVAGIIAANPKRKDIGFRGIAPAATILSIRQSSANYHFEDQQNQANSVEAAGNLGTLAKAIRRAADAGATVINMSVDSCRPTSKGPITEAEKQVQAALRYAVEVRNVVAVASAGNRGENNCSEQNGPDPKNPTYVVTPPWFSDYVISVAAMDRNGDPAEFSIQGPWVSVAAPGTEITSLDPASRTGLANQTVNNQGQASAIQGTSFAAPYVSGLAALVRERFPDLSAKEVMNRIKATSSHPAAAGGHDSLVGYGMINPIGALTAMIPAEEGIPADEAIKIPFEMPPPHERNWSPMQVAMIGSGGGVGLLLLTLFVVHTVRRNRRSEEDSLRARRRL